MSLLSRVANLIQIKAQQLLNRLETPEATLEHSYEHLLASLQEAKLHRAEIAAEERGLDQRLAAAEPAAAEAEAAARTAIAAGDEAAARQALARKQALRDGLGPIRQAQADLAEQGAKLAEYEAMLETRLEQIRMQRDMAEVTQGASAAQTRAGRSLAGMGSDLDRADQALRQVEAKSAAARAKAEAVDRMIGSGALADPLDHRSATERELATLRAGNAVDAELERLKAEIEAGRKPAG